MLQISYTFLCYFRHGQGRNPYATYIIHDKKVIECNDSVVRCTEYDLIQQKVERFSYIFFYTKLVANLILESGDSSGDESQ